MIRLALASALSDRASEGRIAVLDEWAFTEPRTRDALSVLEALDLTGKVMVVVAADDEVAMKSFRNLPDVQLVTTNELNAYDILCNEWILFTRGVIPGATGDLDTSSAKAAPAVPEVEPEPPAADLVADEPVAEEDEVAEDIVAEDVVEEDVVEDEPHEDEDEDEG
jgi:large subunit ribosomal protein L4